MRFGGEEFIVVCIGLSYEEMMILAEKIRVDIFDPAIPHTFSEYKKISSSIGFAVANESFSGMKNEMIKIADNCLYEAKKTGRNRVVGRLEFMPAQKSFLIQYIKNMERNARFFPAFQKPMGAELEEQTFCRKP